MLSKKYRLSSAELKKTKRVFKKSQFFSIKQSPSGLAHGRVAVVVSKKVAKLASERNRIRRAAYSFFRKNKGVLEKEKKDLVLIVRPPAGELSAQAIENVLKKEFNN